jgi:hypothetical protein
VLLVGGADPPVASAEKIDLTRSSPQWQPAGAMNMARTSAQCDRSSGRHRPGDGGSSAPGFDNAAGAVLNGELWDPSANSFTQLARGLDIAAITRSLCCCPMVACCRREAISIRITPNCFRRPTCSRGQGRP